MKNKSKIVTIVGARPQFVKAAVVSKAISEYLDIEEILIHTGQHYDSNMSEIFFTEMSIKTPKYNLGVGGGTHGQNTGRMIESIERLLIAEDPQCILLYGDTDSTLAGAIAASKLMIPIAHVESGLRSYRRDMPEEINRVITDQLSDVLYVPSLAAIKNLTVEGIDKEKIINTGDVMYDAVLYIKEIANKKSSILQDLNLNKCGYILFTLHRKENTDNSEKLKNIFLTLSKINKKIVFPIHPRTLMRVHEYGICLPKNMVTIDPLGYIDTVKLIQFSELVLTDSGGMQKEAYFLKRPCVTLRDETEWVELIECGANVLAGANPELIEESIKNAKFPTCSNHIYGTGNASKVIADDLHDRYAH